MTARRVVLIDGTALVYRAFYAMPRALRSPDGRPTNAAYGFATLFQQLATRFAPDAGAVVFDAPGPTFRHLADPGYKRRRPPMPDELRSQLPLIEAITRAAGFPVLREPRVEADDVLGTLATRAAASGDEVVLVSGDKDFCQLVSEHITLREPLRDAVIDADWVQERWGVSPEQFVDLLALMGDSIDDIPGVPGIGGKTAARLLRAHGSLDGIYRQLDQVPDRWATLLVRGRERALASRELAQLKLDVDLGDVDLALAPVDRAARNAIYVDLGFTSLLEAERAPAPDDLTHLVDDDVTEAWIDAQQGGLCMVLPVVDDAGAVLGIALHAQTTGWWDARTHDLPALLADWLGDPDEPVLTHGCAQVLSALRPVGVSLLGVEGDTALGSFLLDPAGLVPHELHAVVRRFIEEPAAPLERLCGRGERLAQVEPARLAAAAGALAGQARRAWDRIEIALSRANLVDLLFELDLPLAYVIADLQDHGLAVDTQRLEALDSELSARADAAMERVHALAGQPFNPRSTQQLAAVLYDELGLPVLRHTRTARSTDAAVLERLAEQHPIAQAVLDWRHLDTLVTSSTAVLRRSLDPRDRRVHTTLSQTASVSGRLIASAPDLQRTPLHSADGRRVRDLFVAAPGHLLLSADYGQIELRLLAHLSGDEVLLSALSAGEDVHRHTAAAVLGLPLEQVDAEQRQLGKAVNFATLYGQGAAALARQVGVQRDEASAWIARYFQRFRGVAAWRDDAVASARRTGQCTTLLGRRRLVRELSADDRETQSYGERIAINTPVQGSAADLCKRAMLRVDRALFHEELGARLVLQIHDELLLEVPADEIERTAALVGEQMRGVYPLRVPLVVGVGWGASWLDAHG